MSSFREDIQTSFIPRYGAVAHIILWTAGAYVLLGVLGVLLYLAGLREYFVQGLTYLTLSPQILEAAQSPWALITHAFVHPFPGINGNFFSLFGVLFNMLWLFWMGRIYREYIGDRSVYGTYFLGTLAGAVLFLTVFSLSPGLAAFADSLSLMPTDNQLRFMLMGSGAGVMALMVATATLLPNYRIGLLFFGLIQLKWLVLIYVVLDFIAIMGVNPGQMLAHLGGAILGYVYVVQRRRGTDLALPFVRLWAWVTNLFKPRRHKPRMKVVRPAPARPQRVEVANTPDTAGGRRAPAPAPAGPAEAAEYDEAKPTQEQIDRILDKIQEVGYDKLTKAEKQALYRFSKE
jgi:membrane associated rhomboid family serine protease